MYPESDLRAAFWIFIYRRAFDERWGSGPKDQRPSAIALDKIEFENWINYQAIGEDDQGVDLSSPYFPRFYRTLQEALIAFLIDMTARGKWPHPYETWLRLVVLVTADAQRDPTRWLQINTLRPDSEPSTNRGGSLHVMTVSDDWSCLTHDTFEAIQRLHSGTEPQPSSEDPSTADS
jgi:hypothetical protein